MIRDVDHDRVRVGAVIQRIRARAAIQIAVEDRAVLEVEPIRAAATVQLLDAAEVQRVQYRAVHALVLGTAFIQQPVRRPRPGPFNSSSAVALPINPSMLSKLLSMFANSVAISPW